MLRVIFGFAAGLLTAKLLNSPERLDNVKSVAKENMQKIKKASGKVADAVKDEFGKKRKKEKKETEDKETNDKE